MLLRSLIAEKSGNFAITTALCLVPILGAIGVSVDYISLNQKTAKLQQAADAAALATVKELSIKYSDDATLEAIS